MRLAPLAILTAVFAIAALAPTPPDAGASGGARGSRGDSLATTTKSLRKSFKQTAADADRTFRNAATLLQRGLASGATSGEQAALGFGDALAFYAASLKVAADDASAEFADAAVAKMSASGDDSLEGAMGGDGGSFDVFAEDLAKALTKYRSKASKRIAKFRKALARDGGARTEMRVRLEAWTVTPRPVPTIDGPFAAWDEPLRLWGVALTRLSDGRVAYTAFGSAPPSLDELFDVRLQSDRVRPLGDFLADGGMDVQIDGTWRRSGTLGDPLGGDGVPTGPRQVYFGVEPEDQGLAGLQPTRRVHASAISVP